MVYPTLKEPFPGWIDNMYGPIGLSIVTGKGLFHVFYCDKNGNEDMVPADIIIKAILVTTWKLGLTTYDNQHKYVC
ncbi:PREDICTED: fatty acyl-CoA reductase 1-like [Wasmannia auropunctata]|uniref:fatty acyl-CoA reductase 1-like n=1 Tax=Wasmannia auropunctata TaxID=64793 RepID=UPI0005F07974|nr:PREDICTED: fatty acyl-CoA reductase 1-like [Wasmannia auropunctata]